MLKDTQQIGFSLSTANPAVRSYAWLFQITVLAAAYFVTGKLGAFLAILPGYATAIWPPSGIALGGILIYGYRAWPGILLGSFLVNFSALLVSDSPAEILISAITTLVIGGGASLQAIAGAYLVGRFAGFPNPLTREKEVFLFLFYGGFLSTLINSTIAVSTLVITGTIPSANFTANWGTWWMGDMLGIFVFTPLVLVWGLRPSKSWRNRRMAITLPIVAMFALITVAVFYEAQDSNERLKFEFGQQATELSVALEKSILNFVHQRLNHEWLILLVGLIMTGMGGAFVMVFSGRGSVLRQLVDERTAALVQSEERFRSTFEGAPVGVVNMSLDGCFTAVNQGFCDLVGYSRDELLTMTFRQLTHPDFRQADADRIRQTLAGEISGFNVEKQYLHKDGRLVWGNLSATLIRHADGSPDYFIAVIENIDHRKQVEKALKENEVFEQAILNSVVAEIAVLDRDGVILTVNEPWRRFAIENGSKPGVAAANTDVGTNYLDVCKAAGKGFSAEGALKAYYGIRAVLDGHLPSFSQEYPCHSLQQQRWFSMSVTPLGDTGQGGVVITHMNITVRKQAEELLRIAAIAFECQEGIMVMDANLKILRVNRAFTQITGYSQQEVEGKPAAILRSDRHSASFYDTVWNEAKSIGAWQGELWQRRKKGEDFPAQVMITAVRDEGGHVTHYVGNIADATNSKLHEQQRLLDEAAHRNILVREVHHRIKNNLQGITGILRHFAETHPEMSDPINQAISQMQSISVIHGLQGRSVTSVVRMCELLVAIASGIESMCQKPVAVEIPEVWIPCVISEAEAVPLALVVNELIWNAIKHGGAEGHVKIMLSQGPHENSIQLTIHNTGRIPVEFGFEDMSAFGTGLQLVSSLLPRAGAALAWSQQGDIVVTTLGLEEPIIQRAPSLPNAYES